MTAMSTLNSTRMPDVNENLMTPEEAAEYIGFAVSTMRIWRKERRKDGVTGPEFVRLGHRTIRYRKSDLDAFITKGAGK